MTDTIRLVDWSDDSLIGEVEALDESWYQRELEKASIAKLRADRGAIASLSLAQGDDKVYLNTDQDTSHLSTVQAGDEFGGRLKNILWRGEQAILIVDSFIKDAKDAKPTGDGTGKWHYENVDDSTIISDTIDRISSLSKGTIQTVETGLSYRFSYVSQAKVLTTVEDAGSGEIFVHPDGTVDYVDTLGRDLTSITIDDTDHRLAGSFNVERAGDDRKVNKLRAVGTGEGPGAITSDITASGFNSSTDRAKWGVRVNKDISDSTTLDTFANGIIGELSSDFIAVNVPFRNAHVRLGDEYHFTYSPKSIDHDLRAARVKSILTGQGRLYEATWSNRKKTRRTQHEELVESVKKSGRVIEGYTVPLSVSSGPNPVSPNVKHRFSIPYPSDILQEIRVDLKVRGLEEYDDDNDTLTGDFPENVDVRINGTSLGESFGDGTFAFNKTVDLSGELDQGTINTVDLTSDRKARTYAVLDAEIYREMTGT